MVVSFRFFLTLNSDDGSKPTPTMETQPVFDGDGKSLYYLLPILILSPNFRFGRGLNFRYSIKLHYDYPLF